MIRVALCDINREEGVLLRKAINAVTSALGLFNTEVRMTHSCENFLQAMQNVRPGLFDFAIIRVFDREGKPAAELLPGFLSQVAEVTPQTQVILVSDNPAHAILAYDAGAHYLQLPADQAGFVRAVGQPIKRTAQRERTSFAVKSGKIVVNMNLNDITFVETNKKGPIIHLPGNRTIPVRGTLQALYERLNSLDDCFMRAGGSFIINLDNARSVGESSVIFADGDAIILPVRARKPVREAFQARQLRA